MSQPIPEITIFAYGTKGEALEIANNTVEPTLVAAIQIMLKGKPAELPVAFVVLPQRHYQEVLR